ncbi:MerR family transcriptional regulator [Methylocystis parvus]|uniref:MerR family transcriptional regulator n=1 Tax=Methylocystis parvus TaxID=134 RepID=UPI003C74355B
MAARGALSREEIATLRTIGDVAEHLDLPQHVLRFWETRFKEIDPVKRAGGRRFYRPRDIELVEAIRHLLYREGYTIKGVQRILQEQGVDNVIADVRRRQNGESPSAPTAAPEQEPVRTEPQAPEFPPPASGPGLQATLDLPEPEPLVFAPEPPPVAPAVDARLAEPPVEAPARPPAPAPVFNAPVVVTRRLDQEQSQILRQVLAEIEECKRLLNLTRR